MASSPARAVSDQAPAPVLGALPADLPVYLTTALVADVAAGDAAMTSSLVAALAAVPDVRGRRGRRHELTGVLAIAACACLTGATSYVAIGEWAAAQGCAVLDCLGEESPPRALPREATLRRCLQATDAAALDAAVAGWAGRQLAARQARAASAVARLVAPVHRRRVIAIDGKTLRGSAPRATPEQVTIAAHGGGRVHLVAAYDHASGITLGQVACANEVGKGGRSPRRGHWSLPWRTAACWPSRCSPPTPASPPASGPPICASAARTGFCGSGAIRRRCTPG